MRNGTILTLHIIPSRKVHTVSFQMAYNVAVGTVGTSTLSARGGGGAQRPGWPNSQLPIRNLLLYDAQTW